MSPQGNAGRGVAGRGPIERSLALLAGDTPSPAWVFPAIALVLWLSGAWLLLGAGASYTSVWLNDEFGLLAAAHRMAEGQVPSADFRSIYGVFTYLPLAGALKAGVAPGLVLPVAHVVASAMLAMLAVVVVRRRFGLVAAVLVLLATCTLVQAPVVMGKSPVAAMSFGVFYNRFGWAFLTLVLLYFVDPVTSRRRDVLADALALATLLALLLYGIFNYGVIALGFVVVNAFTSRHKRNVALVAAPLLLAIAAAIEWLMPGYHSAYLSQLFPRTGVSGQASPGLNRVAGALLREGMDVAALATVALAICTAIGGWRWTTAGYVAGGVGACVILSTQTGSGTVGMPAIAGVLACTAELARRSARAAQPTAPRARRTGADPLPLLALGLLLVAVAQPVVTNLQTLLLHHLYASQPAPRQAALSPPTGLAAFRVGPWQQDPFATVLGRDDTGDALRARLRRELRWPLPTSVYYETVVDGLRLLGSHAPRNARVVVFDKVDPFSVVLGLPPTCRGVPLFWTDRIRDPARMPTEAEFIADADIAMVPRSPYDQSQIDNLWRRYGAHLQRHFELVHTSAHWQLWARKGAPMRDCPRDAGALGPK